MKKASSVSLLLNVNRQRFIKHVPFLPRNCIPHNFPPPSLPFSSSSLHSAGRRLESFAKPHGSIFKFHQFQTNPSWNLCSLAETVEETRPRWEREAERKAKMISDLKEAFRAAETSEEMIKAFKDMEEAEFDEALLREEKYYCFKTEMKNLFDEGKLAIPSLRIGFTLNRDGKDPEKALSFAERALKFWDQKNKPSLQVVMTLQLIGSIHYSLKKFKEGEEIFARAGRLLRRMVEGCSDSVEDAKQTLSRFKNYLEDQKVIFDYSKLTLLEYKNYLDNKEKERWEFFGRELGEVNRDVAEAYVSVLNFKEALPFCLEALEIHTKERGLDSVEVVNDRTILEAIYTGMGEHEKASEQNELSYEVLKDVGISSEWLRAEICLADMQIELGKYNEAIDNLKGLDRHIEKGSVNQASSFILMGSALWHQEKPAESKMYLENACGILDNMETVSPIQLAEAYSEVSMLYQNMKEFESAIPLLKRTLALLEKQPQELQFEGFVFARIGKMLLLSDEARQAIPYLVSGAARLKEGFGTSEEIGVFYFYIYYSLGVAYLKLDRPETAAKMFAVTKRIMDISLDPFYVYSIEACQNLSDAYSYMGNYTMAIQIQQRVIRAWKRHHGTRAEDGLQEAKRILKELWTKACGTSDHGDSVEPCLNL